MPRLVETQLEADLQTEYYVCRSGLRENGSDDVEIARTMLKEVLSVIRKWAAKRGLKLEDIIADLPGL